MLGGSENTHESIILDCLPSTRNLDIYVKNVHSYPLECVVYYRVIEKDGRDLKPL